MLGVG
jgi:hypothetical protein